MERTLDWKPRFDEKSKKFTVIRGVDYSNKYIYRWPLREVLDQGEEGACVGFGWTAAIGSSPIRQKLPNNNTFAFGIYDFAKYIDEWEGENYDGTSVLAGAKTLNKLGLIKGYNWCFNTNDIITALHEFGPVVIGVPWYEGMYQTDDRYFVTINGQLVGGHCLTIYAYNPKKYNRKTKEKKPTFYWRNSWGKSYGRNGSGYITQEDLKYLLHQDGEACVPVYKQ